MMSATQTFPRRSPSETAPPFWLVSVKSPIGPITDNGLPRAPGDWRCSITTARRRIRTTSTNPAPTIRDLIVGLSGAIASPNFQAVDRQHINDLVGVVPQIHDDLAARRLQSHKVLVHDGKTSAIGQMDVKGTEQLGAKCLPDLLDFHANYIPRRRSSGKRGRKPRPPNAAIQSWSRRRVWRPATCQKQPGSRPRACPRPWRSVNC